MGAAAAQLTATIRRIPGTRRIVSLLRRPIEESHRWEEYLRFRNRFGRMLELRGSRRPGARLLVMNPIYDDVAWWKHESIFVKACQLQGYEVFVVTTRGAWTNTYHRLSCVDGFAYLDDAMASALHTIRDDVLDGVLRSIQSPSDLLDVTFEGVRIGQYVAASLVRRMHIGALDVSLPEVRAAIRTTLHQSMAATRAAQAILHNVRPTAALFADRGYTPCGEFFDLAVARGCNTVQWNGWHHGNADMIKRYHSGNVGDHHGSLSAKTWEMLRAAPWDDGLRQRIRGELSGCYERGAWFDEVGTQRDTRRCAPEEIRAALGLDSRKRTVVIFSHMFWDATFLWGDDLFSDYEEWFRESVRAAAANDRVQWILKLHPANVVKLARDGYVGELAEKRTIREVVGELPSHVRVLEPDTFISTWSLLSAIDCAVTVRGTVGIEAALFGVPVVTAGTGRYDRHGFTVDSTSRVEYLNRLARIENIPRLTPEQIELAEKFAYGTFIVRPFTFTSIRNTYRRDGRATLDVEYLINSPETLRRAEDIRAFGEWFANGRDEDFLHAAFLRDEIDQIRV